MGRESGRRGGSNAPRREQDSRDKRIEKLERENGKLVDDLAVSGHRNLTDSRHLSTRATPARGLLL